MNDLYLLLGLIGFLVLFAAVPITIAAKLKRALKDKQKSTEAMQDAAVELIEREYKGPSQIFGPFGESIVLVYGDVATVTIRNRSIHPYVDHRKSSFTFPLAETLDFHDKEIIGLKLYVRALDKIQKELENA
jgi:hypothetical protein